MTDDKNLHDILKDRAIPEPASNLSHRIIQAAEERQKYFNSSSLLDQITKMFIVPKPAYITAFCLLVGIVVGFYTGE